MRADTGRDGKAANLRAALRVADLLDAARVRAGSDPVAPEQGAVVHLLTDGAPDPHVWQRAWTDVLDQESARVTRSGLGWILTSLASGRLTSLSLLEVGCERLRLNHVAYGADGSAPEIREVAESRWIDLVSAADRLPAARLSRLFLLAGGIAEEGKGIHAGNGAATSRRAASLPGTGGTAADLADELGQRLRAFACQAAQRTGPLLVVVRAAGWPLLERATESLRDEDGSVVRLRLPARLPTTPDDLFAGLPLRNPVWLAGAHVDTASGTVGLARRVLFPAGSRPGGHADAGTGPHVGVSVAAPPGGATVAHSVAAVVSAGQEDPPSYWRPLRADRLELPPGTRALLRYRLVGPDRVDLHYDGRHEPETSPWAALALHTPRRLARPRPVDLVLAVEIAGPQADGGVAVDERLQEAVAVVEAVREAVGGEESLRVGLIGYRDHAPLDRPHHSDPLVHRVALSDPRAAEQALGGWHRSALRHDFATGLEHVPHELSFWRDAWRPDSHRVLLVVGSRPPHPRSRPPQVLRRGAAVRICPDRVEWETALRSVRHYDGVTCVAVVDEPTWMDHLAGEPHLARWADRAWDLFGAEGRFVAGHDPRSIASAVAAPALGPPEDGTPIRLVVSDGVGGDWLPAAAG